MRWLGVVLVILGIIGIASAAPMAHPMGKSNPEWAGNLCTHNLTHLRLHNQTCLENNTCVQIRNQTCVQNVTMPVEHRHHRHYGIKTFEKRFEKRIEKRLIEERIREIKIRHRIAGIHMNIQKAKQMVENARMKYEKAREMYMKLRARGLKDPKTFRYAKQYICFGVDYVERWLEKLMIQVQNANMGENQKERIMERIQNCLMALNESKNAVNSSMTPDELQNAVLELRKTWNEVRIEIKSIVGQIAVTKLEDVVNRADDVALKLEGEIEALNVSNVTNLEQKLNDCLEKLNLAKQKLEDANEKFEEMANASNPNELYVEGRHLLIEARDLIREAFMDIKDIYYEIWHLRVGHVFYGNETGELLVVGNGTAEIHLTGVAVILASGNVTVSPATSVVTSVGFESSVEGGVASMSGHGKVVVRGKDVTVRVKGEYIKIFVKGNGTATLNGEGIYKLKKSPHEKMVEETYSGNVTLEFGVVE